MDFPSLSDRLHQQPLDDDLNQIMFCQYSIENCIHCNIVLIVYNSSVKLEFELIFRTNIFQDGRFACKNASWIRLLTLTTTVQ